MRMGIVPRNRVPPFSHHSRGAIFRRWRKLPTIRTRRGTPAGAQASTKAKARARSGQAFEEGSRRGRRAPRPSRPDLPPTDPALAELLNPGIGQGTAGPGSQTGLKPPPDNSFDRRADFSAAHRARKSTGFGEAPQAGYGGKGPAPSDATPSGVDSELAQALGFEGDDAADGAAATRTPSRPSAASPAPPPRCRRWKRCCARAARNSASGRGRRTARRGRKNPKAAGRW